MSDLALALLSVHHRRCWSCRCHQCHWCQKVMTFCVLWPQSFDWSVATLSTSQLLHILHWGGAFALPLVALAISSGLPSASLDFHSLPNWICTPALPQAPTALGTAISRRQYARCTHPRVGPFLTCLGRYLVNKKQLFVRRSTSNCWFNTFAVTLFSLFSRTCTPNLKVWQEDYMSKHRHVIYQSNEKGGF